jgi:hypothetical protein
MKIIDTKWTEDGNQVKIQCECGYEFWWPIYYVVCECINCLKQEALYSGPGLDEMPIVQFKIPE